MFYDIYLYTLCYCICCLLGACMRCTWLCSLKPGVTANEDVDIEGGVEPEPASSMDTAGSGRPPSPESSVASFVH
jgi:hypothetical protein